MFRPEYHLVDGENLVTRYQELVQLGRTPLAGIQHKKDVYIWRPHLISGLSGDIRRVNYYASVIGDDDHVHRIATEIQTFRYHCQLPDMQRDGRLYPRVFKKLRASQKSHSVDINIVIDALRHAANGSAGHVTLYSGDGDFIPLVHELMRLGVEVHIKAFSSGLSPLLPTSAQEFALLDSVFFAKPVQSATVP